jgi:putative inorganic carbon (hco3(-)) transporter
MGFNLYLVFIISYFLHLPSRIPLLGYIRFDLLLIVLIAVLIIKDTSSWNRKQPWNLKTVNRLMMFMGLIIITLPLVQWPGSVVHNGFEGYAKVLPFFFFTVVLVNTENKLKMFMFIFIFCQTFRILEPAYLHWTTGYWGSSAHSQVGSFTTLDRLSGAPHDIVNPNQLAWVIVSTIPFVFYLGLQNSNKLKISAIIILSIFLYAMMLTGSRSGLLSLLVLVFAMIWIGTGKMKKLATGMVLVVVLGFIVVGNLSPDLKLRYLSIVDRSAPGGDTATGRTNAMKRELSVVWNRPVFGHGLGTSKEISANFLIGRAKTSHNLYVEILQEVGIVGFIFFMLYVIEIMRSLKKAKQLLISMPLDNTWLLQLITATQAWIAMHLFYSLSCFGLTSWEWYLFGGVSTVCLKLSGEYVSNGTINREVHSAQSSRPPKNVIENGRVTSVKNWKVTE